MRFSPCAAMLAPERKSYSLAEARQVPVYVVKSNNLPQIQKALREALHLDTADTIGVDIEGDVDETEVALEEARQAITRVMDGKSRWN